MNKLKQSLEREIDVVLPKDFGKNMHKSVMKAVRPQPVLSKTLSEHRENIILGIVICLFTTIVYIFTYDKNYAISLYINVEWAWEMFKTVLCTGVVFLFFINEYFDTKKKVSI